MVDSLPRNSESSRFGFAGASAQTLVSSQPWWYGTEWLSEEKESKWPVFFYSCNYTSIEKSFLCRERSSEELPILASALLAIAKAILQLLLKDEE
jgi:hypothetical protein